MGNIAPTDLLSNNIPDNYLENEKKKYTDQDSYCNFYDYRLQEISEKISSLTPIDEAAYLLKKNRSIPQLLSRNLESVNTQLPNKNIQLSSLPVETLAGLGLILIISLIFKYYLLRYEAKWMKKKIFFISLSDLPVILSLGIGSIYLNFYNAYSNSLITLLISSLSIYLGTIFLIRNLMTLALHTKHWQIILFNFWNSALYIFSFFYILLIVNLITRASESTAQLVNLRAPLVYLVLIEFILLFLTHGKKWLEVTEIKLLEKRTIFFISQIYLSYISYWLLKNLALSPQVLEAYKTILIILFNMSLLLILKQIIYKTNFFIKHCSKAHKNVFKICLKIIFIVSIVALWEGYQTFSLLIIPNFLITLIALYALWDLTHFMSRLYFLFYHSPHPLPSKMRSILGLKPKDKLIELFILRLILNIPIAILLFTGLTELWGLSHYKIEYFFNSLHIGYDFLGFTIHIPLIIRAINVFCAVSLLGKVFATYIERHLMNNEEHLTRYLVGSLVRYFILSVAFILSLSIAQINMQGILVVTGALSLGLGFGLQNFVKDFLSGFIIMFQKVIKIGDHLVVD